MRIKDVYLRKGNYTVSVIFAALCIAVTSVSTLFPDTYEALACAYPIQYPWQVCSGIFLHGSPELPMAGSIGHLVFNLLLILSFGILVEKILGSKSFAVMTIVQWAVYAITFFVIAMVVTPKGETAYGAGISGIAFSYGTIGLYVLFVLGKKNFKLLFRQVSFYLLFNIVVTMIIMVNPHVAGVSSMIIHIVAIVFGTVYVAVYHKKIDAFFNNAGMC